MVGVLLLVLSVGKLSQLRRQGHHPDVPLTAAIGSPLKGCVMKRMRWLKKKPALALQRIVILKRERSVNHSTRTRAPVSVFVTLSLPRLKAVFCVKYRSKEQNSRPWQRALPSVAST